MIVSTLALDAVLAHDRVRPHLADGAGHHLDVRLDERRIPLVCGQDALAADRVARPQLLPQRRVLDLVVQVPERHLLDEAPEPRAPELQHEALACPVDAGPHGELRGREDAVDGPLPAAERPVAVRHHPRRRPLEDVQLLDLRLDLRDELDRRRPRSDHRHALARQLVLVVPARRVEDRPLEALESGQVRRVRIAQRPLRGDHDIGGQLALRRLDPPQLRVLVPVGGQQLAVEADVRHHAVALGAAAQVVEDLGLRRERARPVGVRGERERVEVRGHVAAAAGIGVVAPGAADLRGALEDGEVELPLLAQLDCHPEPREAGADDDDPMVSHVNLRSPGSRSSTVQSASRSIGTSGCSHIQWATPS